MASENFGIVERRLARVLSYFPGVKQQAKKAYQTINFHLHKKNHLFQSELSPITRVGDSPYGEFFGYFQNSPERNGQIAYLAPKNDSLKYQKCFPVDILINGEKVSQSTAWNWQQGCMLWWLNDQEICHNVFEENAYRTRIVNLASGKYRPLDLPLCAVSSNGEQGYSIDFENLAHLNPDYGYFCKSIDRQQHLQSHALHSINIPENRILASLSMQKILDLNLRPEFDNAQHEINHIAASPDGQRIMFIHRWYLQSGIRKSRLITASSNLTDLYCLTEGEMVSHCTWKNNSQIAGWLQLNISTRPHYHLLNDQSKRAEHFGEKVLRSDGHPTIIGQDWILTDTYPNRARMSQLLLYNLVTHDLIELGEFCSPLKFSGNARCDLHPKYSPDSKSVFFESTHTGQRCLYQMDLAKFIGL